MRLRARLARIARSILPALAVSGAAMSAPAAVAQNLGDQLYYKVSGKSTIMVHSNGSQCILTIRSFNPTRMASFTVGSSLFPSAAFYSEKRLVGQDRNSLQIQVFKGGKQPVSTPLRFGIVDQRAGLYAHISLNPQVSGIIWNLRNSRMLMWGQQGDFVDTQHLAYEPIDILVASMFLDGCKSAAKQKRESDPKRDLDFDWLIPR